MSLRLIVAYVLIVLVAAALGAVYLHFTRENRAWGRALRAYRRQARKTTDKNGGLLSSQKRKSAGMGSDALQNRKVW